MDGRVHDIQRKGLHGVGRDAMAMGRVSLRDMSRHKRCESVAARSIASSLPAHLSFPDAHILGVSSCEQSVFYQPKER